MPRFNVPHKNKWACFSSFVDGFITDFTDKVDYEEWRKCQYGMCGFKPAEECNVMTLKKAVSLIRMHNDYADSLAHLIEVGLSQEEAEKLIYNIETECWCPILRDNGKYECPNCGSEVVSGQVFCKNDTCEIEFIWRT